MARYIIYGAGGVGCLIGARLHATGHEVILVARGAHAAALAENGLRLHSAAGEAHAHVPVVDDVALIAFHDDDIVILAMKTQDSLAALEKLAAVAPPGITVACAQNGLESERMALRLFEHVVAVYVVVFAASNAPGVVSAYSWPSFGILDVGLYPAGSDARSATIAADFGAAGFRSKTRDDIMAWKRGKLLINLFNPLDAACPPDDQPEDVLQAALAEARRCFDAADAHFVDRDAVMDDWLANIEMAEVDGAPFPGGSTVQGLMRGSGTSEVDYFNGEVVLMGRMLGIPTPANAALQRVMRQLATSRATARQISADALRRMIA